MTKITIEQWVNAPISKVWDYWTQDHHIKNWYFASDDWMVPFVHNPMKIGDDFTIRMEAKDKSAGFDYSGKYLVIIPLQQIEYKLGDERYVSISFLEEKNAIRIIETFDAENTFSLEVQKRGWQSILNNFKKYIELN